MANTLALEAPSSPEYSAANALGSAKSCCSQPCWRSISASCSDFSIEVVPTSTGCAALLALVDQGQDRAVLLRRRAIDLVVVVDAHHRLVGRHLQHFKVVDVEELVRLGQRRAGHARQLLVHAEVVLEGDRGQRLVLRLNRLALLRLQRLVQPFRIPPTRHHPPGELVDDHHLAVAHDVVLVALEQLVRPQGLVDVVHGRDVLNVVERFPLEQVVGPQRLLHLLHAGFGQRHRALLLVDLVVPLLQPRDIGVDRVVELRAVVQRTRNDQRGSGLVDQDRSRPRPRWRRYARAGPCPPAGTSCCRADSRSRARCWCRRSRRRRRRPCAARRRARARSPRP